MHVVSVDGQADDDLQPTVAIPIDRVNVAAMQADGPLDDGEADPGAAGVAVTRRPDAIERPKDFSEFFFWNAGPVIANDDLGEAVTVVVGGAHGAADGAAFRGEAHGVPEHVFKGAAEELWPCVRDERGRGGVG